MIDALEELNLQLFWSFVVRPAKWLLTLRIKEINLTLIYISYLLTHDGCVRTQVLDEHIR